MGRTSDAKERLMKAAIFLIWEESYGAVTIDEICKKADVRKGSFYYFFPGKAELAVAALEELWRTEWKPFLDEHLSPAIEPYARIKGYLEAIAQRQRDLAAQRGKVLGCPVVTMGSEVCTCQDVVSVTIRELLNRKRKYYESAIRDAMASGVIEPGDASERATALFSILDGLVAQARILNDVRLFEAIPKLGAEVLRLKAPALA